MSLRDRINQQAHEERGFKPHPCGKFNAVVQEVKEIERNGKVIFEIHLRSGRGQVKKDIFHTQLEDIDGILLNNCDGDRTKAESIYVSHMSNIQRMLQDLGVGIPESSDDKEYETGIYFSLSGIVGKDCRIVVIPGKTNPDFRTVYINKFDPEAVDELAGDRKETRTRFNGKSESVASSGFPASGGLEEIPF